MKKIITLIFIILISACSTSYKANDKDKAESSYLSFIREEIRKEKCSYMNTQKILYGIPVYMPDYKVVEQWGKKLKDEELSLIHGLRKDASIVELYQVVLMKIKNGACKINNYT